mgnify:CR=1 FL=1
MAIDLTAAFAIAELSMRMGRVHRITQHPDGHPESDAEHSLMLALVAAEYAPARLDRELILGYALVHDLVEAAGAGDTPSLVELTPVQASAKDAREAAALEVIRAEVGADSWLVKQIEDYEAQTTSEARWVRHLDKCMPKLTHAFNGGAAIRAQGVTLEATARRVEGQIGKIDPALPEAVEFARAAWVMVEARWQPVEGR